ncbi:MAG: diacylglycerol kinase family lipid kinase [Candidatus Goldbacteria bacterium]|nr:diacylglycerol kinase family lipid kinase [Candidatus Goldiibacteriota bacterium]
MDRVIFIINPRSGFKINKFVERNIINKISVRRINYAIEYTKQKGDAFTITIKYLNKGFNRVVCVGGDGTLREILEAVAGKNNVIVGIIPCGSGNGAARNLKIPLNLDEAFEIALGNKIVDIDCGICNSKLFFNICGIGFDAHIAKMFNKNRIRGLLPYFLYGIISYIKFKPIDIEVEYGGKKDFFKPFVVAVANGSQYGGGAIISPRSSLIDGKLDLIVVDNTDFFYLIRRIHTLFNGKILENDKVKYLTSEVFKIKLPPGSIYHLDGEDFISEDGVLKITTLPKAVKFAVKNEIL